MPTKKTYDDSQQEISIVAFAKVGDARNRFKLFMDQYRERELPKRITDLMQSPKSRLLYLQTWYWVLQELCPGVIGHELFLYCNLAHCGGRHIPKSLSCVNIYRYGSGTIPSEWGHIKDATIRAWGRAVAGPTACIVIDKYKKNDIIYKIFTNVPQMWCTSCVRKREEYIYKISYIMKESIEEGEFYEKTFGFFCFFFGFFVFFFLVFL